MVLLGTIKLIPLILQYHCVSAMSYRKGTRPFDEWLNDVYNELVSRSDPNSGHTWKLVCEFEEFDGKVYRGNPASVFLQLHGTEDDVKYTIEENVVYCDVKILPTKQMVDLLLDLNDFALFGYQSKLIPVSKNHFK